MLQYGWKSDPGVTWADVVRKPAVTNTAAVASNTKKVPTILSKATAGIGKRPKSMNVFQRSFSQNNPVNRIKVQLTLISVSNLLERLRYQDTWFMTYQDWQKPNSCSHEF